ncbi:MAG: ankyrin repeat domain-containing protein [Leptospiraceae bacterium]|nr:ankyrin repeat domain-containing protein [Leptospiraceae bacterium]
MLNQAINRKKFNAALLNRIVAMGALNASANSTPPLCTAIRTGHIEALELLLRAGALPVCRDEYKSVSMIPADVYADRFAPPESKQQMLQLLPTSPQCMLDRAARAGNITEAHELLSSNPHMMLDNTSVYLIFLSTPVDVDGSNSVDVNNGVQGGHHADGSSGIYGRSVVNGSANINRTALDRLGDFNMPIMLYALQQKNVAFVDFLLRNDVPPDFTYQYHTPALITAARILPEAIPYLLAYKSGWPAEELNDALLRSAEKEQFDNMRLLLMAGASVHVQTYNGLNLLHFARYNRAMYQLLRDLGLYPDKAAERFLYEKSEQDIDPESGAESDLESGTNRQTDRRSEGIDQENTNENRMILEAPRELEFQRIID